MNRGVALWVVAIGAIALFAFKKNAATPTGNATDVGGPLAYKPSQPSQLFPVVGIKDPRVDFASQPWYTGPFIPSDSSTGNNMGGDQFSGAPLSEVWASFDNMFGSSAPQSLNNPGRIDSLGKAIA